jgi:hypothetical protein
MGAMSRIRFSQSGSTGWVVSRTILTQEAAHEPRRDATMVLWDDTSRA